MDTDILLEAQHKNAALKGERKNKSWYCHGTAEGGHQSVGLCMIDVCQLRSAVYLFDIKI